MKSPKNLYREEADFMLRENMNKLKGLVDLLDLGILESMEAVEQQEFIAKIKENTDSLFEKLEHSIQPGE